MRPFLLREHVYSSFDFCEGVNPPDILFKKRRNDGLCATFKSLEGKIGISTSYYVGADWIPDRVGDHWVYVESKLNTKFDEDSGEEQKPQEEKELVQIDVLKMLFQALEEPDVRDHTKELFEIKFDSPWIQLQKNQDLISPLIMIQFLNQVKDIVRKGLKRSYYKVERNLYAKVKGKVLVSQTIKQNLVKNKNLNTYCQYEQFGVDGLENRLLKKTLTFIRRYLGTYKSLGSDAYFEETFNFIQPAFEGVSEEVQLHEIKHFKFNPFYKNYEKAIELAKLILQRFSYNLNSIQDQETILTPPYWIDMSKLFELYVLAKLKKRFKWNSRLEYQFGDRANSIDYLLHSDGNKMVIDAKYKAKYSYHFVTEDMRQVSGYARLKKVHKFFGLAEGALIDCLIIYPDLANGNDEIPENLTSMPVNDYYGVYKLGLILPLMKTK